MSPLERRHCSCSEVAVEGGVSGQPRTAPLPVPGAARRRSGGADWSVRARSRRKLPGADAEGYAVFVVGVARAFVSQVLDRFSSGPGRAPHDGPAESALGPGRHNRRLLQRQSRFGLDSDLFGLGRLRPQMPGLLYQVFLIGP
jgi:hypothetical protein